MFRPSIIKSSMNRLATEIACKLYEQDTSLSEYEIVPIQCKTHKMLISQGHHTFLIVFSLIVLLALKLQLQLTLVALLLFFVISYGTLRPSELESLMVMTTDQLL